MYLVCSPLRAALVALSVLCAAELSAAKKSTPPPQMPPDLAGLPGMPAMPPGMAGYPGMPPAYGAPASAPAPAPAAIETALVTVPPLAPGAELSYKPISLPTMPAVDPEKAAREAQQRAQQLEQDLRTIGPIQDLPEVGSAAFEKLRADALAILKRRFQESRGKLEADAAPVFSANVTWTPDFSATPRPVAAADCDRARNASYTVAYAINHLDRPRFVLAYAAAVAALDPDSPLGVENAASAILASGERMHPRKQDAGKLKPYREDAAVVYRYALARSVERGRWTLRSLGILVNLGNLYVDMNAPERARPVLLAAKDFAPDSWDAAVALGSCYQLQGRPALARAALEDERLSRPAIFGAAARGSRNLNETLAAAELSPDSSDEAFEAVMQKLDGQQIMTAADFVDPLDQSERNRLRYFVENLPVQGSYRAPGIDGLTQFSTVKSINLPSGIEALGDFAERLGSYSMLMLGAMMDQQNDALGRLGLSVQLNVDMKDVMANPEKYRNREITGTVSGTDQIQARVAEMKRQAEQAQREMATGKTDTLLKMAAGSDPMLAVFAMKPYSYANPMDVMIQQYNAQVLARKMHTYNSYFFAVNNRTRKSLTEIAALHAQKRAAIDAQEDAEMAAFEKRRAAAAKAGQDTNTAQWRLLEHNIHMKFAPQQNEAADFAWKQATQVAAIAYERKIKVKAERFYYDIVRHVALISDPAVREKKNREVEKMLHYAVYQGLANVLIAFGSCEYVEDWDCRCDVGSLQEQAELERKELDRIAEARRARDNEAKLRFASGEIPESSQLFKKLDEYGTDLDIMFIPALSGRISCARTTLRLAAELPTEPSVKLEYAFTENAFTGATTHGGGVEVGVKFEDGPEGVEGNPSISATINVRGSIALDGKGKVTDYSVTGASNVKVEAGPTTLTAGGEIGFTPKGGFTSDVMAGVKTSISNSHGRTLEVSLEASARRGSTFSAMVEQNFNPQSEQMNEFAKEHMGVLKEIFPVDTAIKKELWNGSFSL